jgi:hypothetical protein
MTDIPDQFAFPKDAFERQRSLLTAHLKTQVQISGSPRQVRRQRLIALAAAVLVVVVGTASAIGGIRAFILDQGFIGLPPEGATPSAPESGELILRWSGDSATHATLDPSGVFFNAPFAETWVYADGRMIWWRDGQVPEGANERMSGYLEQRLTPEGVELLRSEVVGLLDRSRTLLETEPFVDDPISGPFGGLALFVPLAHGSGHGSVEVRDGDRLVRLQWRHSDAEAFESTIATPEQLADLRRIDALLTDSTTVLPASVWAVREVRAYVPSHYAVCISTAPPKDASDLLSLLPTQAADVLRDKSRTRLERDLVSNIDQVPGHMVVIGRSVTYCSKLATDEAREIANALSGLTRHPWALSLMYELDEGVNNLGPTTISFDPYFPDGQFLLFGGGR